MSDTGRVVPVSESSAASEKSIRIIKSRDIVPARKDTLLKNVEYLETQIGRLAKMARDIRAEILLLTTD